MSQDKPGEVYHRVPEQPTSQHDDVHVLMFGRFHSYRRAVRDDGGTQVRGQL
jgi:hypothetical protein